MNTEPANKTVQNLSSRKLWMILDKQEENISIELIGAAKKELSRRQQSGFGNRFQQPH